MHAPRRRLRELLNVLDRALLQGRLDLPGVFPRLEALASAPAVFRMSQATGLDFAWFTKTFPRARLEVVCATPFETDRVRGRTLHDFLQGV